MVDSSPVVKERKKKKAFSHQLILVNEATCIYHWIVIMYISMLRVKCTAVNTFFILTGFIKGFSNLLNQQSFDFVLLFSFLSPLISSDGITQHVVTQRSTDY